MKNKNIIRKVINFILLNIGIFIASSGIVYFLIPNKIVTGGASGVAMLLFFLFKIPIGLTMISINAVLISIQAYFIGKNSSYKTIYVIIVQPIIIEYLMHWGGHTTITGDRMLAALFGGILCGIGIGIIFKSGGTSGGSDIVAQIISRKMNFPFGFTLTVIDFSIAILAGISMNSLELALYGIINIYFTAKIIDTILSGFAYTKMIYIISDQYMIISELIMGELGKGVTMLDVTGQYTGVGRKMLMIVVNRRQIFKIKELVRELDPNAFMIVSNASAVFGLGFKYINDQDENTA